LTTYAHLPWNRPFYESAGFVVVPVSECPPEMVAILDDQRRWLPAPDQRIAMRASRVLGGRSAEFAIRQSDLS
jgi:hypothetical protein